MSFSLPTHRRWVSVAVGLFAFSVGASGTQADLIVDGYSADRHERYGGGGSAFIGSASVAGHDLDFSGVGRAISSGAWATMISPNHFVTANHARPSGSVVFHHDNNPSGTTTTRSVIGGTRIGPLTDIWVGEFDEPVGPQVAIYSIAQDAMVMLQDEFYQVGRGRLPTSTDNRSDVRIGKNVISGAGIVQLTNSMDEVTAETASIYFYDDSTAGDFVNDPKQLGAEFVSDETFLQGGDSGGPSFLKMATGELLLVGTHSAIVPSPPGADPPSLFEERRASIDAYLPFYRADIYAIAVPEASQVTALLLLSMALLGLPARRR